MTNDTTTPGAGEELKASDRARGRAASLAGQPRDTFESIEWRDGWDEVEAGRGLDVDEED